jgi:hypothetical protein
MDYAWGIARLRAPIGRTSLFASQKMNSIRRALCKFRNNRKPSRIQVFRVLLHSSRPEP